MSQAGRLAAPLTTRLEAIRRRLGESSRTESPLLRRTRLRLIAWSGGSTLIVLVVLGAAIYAATASSLATAGVTQLRARVNELAVGKVLTMTQMIAPNTIPLTSDPSRAGVAFGGEASGTIAMVVPLETLQHSPLPIIRVANDGLAFPDAAMLAEIEKGDIAIREVTVGSTPLRVLVAPIQTPLGVVVAVVIGDRTNEIGTLETLLVVLLVGGLLVLAASLVVGSVYAGRALVPIRESLRRQREFAADASHELRTPLAITRAAIAELSRGRDDPSTVERAIADLDAGATRLEQLVGDLLLLARTDAEAIELDRVPTDLAHLAAEATESLEPVAAQRGVRLVLDIRPAPTEGDETRLRQLVAILVDNAIRHSPANGRVTVGVRPGATLSVEDEGPGVRPEDLDKVFDRFWRAADAPSGGTGLGLAIARWIAERHAGSIVAANRSDRAGARFIVRLPSAARAFV